MNHQLYTVWGESLHKEQVLKEYPRPTMVRDSYANLNGYWNYAITESGDIPVRFDGRILVPFSPEAVLSEVQRELQPKEFLHYARDFEITQEFLKDRVILHFGAVDQICKVYVNGKNVGEHEGGYLPFEVDISGALQNGSNMLHVVVQDYTDTSYHARGKQKLERGGMFYQAQSGIWQTVWMESVQDEYIQALRITPCYDSGEIEFKVINNSGNKTRVSVSIFDGAEHIMSAEGLANQKIRIALPDFKSWTPETPFLYDAVISMGGDEVNTYFAMRKYAMEKDRNGILRFTLNNKPYFHNGLLDQGYWPDGLYTAPSDEALIYDIQCMKDLGFNTIRKHIKVEPARWYYHCDRIGMLVWQDMINGGSNYHMKFVCLLPNLFMWSGRCIKDNKYRAFSRKDAEGREGYYRELKDMIKHLYNYPSIAVWVPFNEGWGQFDAPKATWLTRKLDPTRLIDEASGWFDQHGGDMYSIHNYWRKLKVKPKKDRVVALTEYGGYSWRADGHSFCSEVYGYKKYDSSEALTEGYARLQEKEIIKGIKDGLCAGIYTQVSDVEEEVNGILTYDRKVIKLIPERVKELNRQLYLEFDKRV